MLVLEDHDYGQRIPIQIGTLHINRVLDLVTKEEIDHLTRSWHRGRIATLVANRGAVL